MKLPTQEQLSILISNIYDCAIAPEGWSDALTRFAQYVEAAYVSISLVSLPHQEIVVAAASPWDPEELARLSRDFDQDIPGLQQLALGPVDTPLSTMQLMDEAQFQTSRFYKEWVAPQGLRDASLCKIAQTGDRMGVMAVVTSAERDIVTHEERAFVQLLAPHFRRAVMISDMLGQQRSSAASYRQLIDRLTIPVILTDRFGRVHQINEAADTLLAEGEVLRVVGGHIQPSAKATSQAMGNDGQRVASLAQAIALAAQGDEHLGRRGIGLMLQAPGQSPLVAYVLPLQASEIRSAFNPAAVAVFLSTRQNAIPCAEAVLATLYDLTPAEIRVLGELIKGQSAKEIAQTLGLSDHTITTHTRHIFAKTGTHKQTQLVALVAAYMSPVA